MDGQGKWSVEAKEFELVVRGGNTGVRFYERNSKTVRSIFLQRAEVAWMDSVVEELAAAKFFEVFWDQSRAGLPRVIVEKCSNRHGNFLRIEEFDGRKRSGSIMIPEGRYGEGWNRLKMEVSKANSSLGAREKWRSNMVMAGKSYAEAVLAAQPGGHDDRRLKSKQDKAPARNSDGSKTKSMVEELTPVVGEEIFTAATGVGNGGIRSASISNPKARSLPAISGVEARSGRYESAGDGSVSMGQRDFRVELQELKNFLTKLKEDVDKGIRRVEEVMGLSDFGGLNMGQTLGCVKAVGYEALKPKKRKNKGKKKNKGKQHLSGPKPGDSRASGNTGGLFTRPAGETRSFQVGESSVAGAVRVEGDMGSKSQLPSILGKFEWVRKAEAPAILSARGSAMQGQSEETQTTPAVGYSEETQTTPVESPVSLVVMGSTVHGQIEEGFSAQVAPVVMSGSCDQSGKAGSLVVGLSEETQILPAERPMSKSAPSGDFGADFPGSCGVGQPEVLMRKSKIPRCLGAVQTEDCLSVPGSIDVSAGVFQPLLGGELSVEPNHVGVEASMLVPWQSGKFILDSGGLGCFVDGEPIPLEICFGRDEGNRDVTPSRHSDLLGMELVPFADEVPISQDWLLAMDDGNSGGCQNGDKGMEIIMAFRQIVGVSCDGHVERLRAAFAHILAGKKKEVKKNRGGGQVGRKGTREILNLFTTVNYDGGSGSVTRSRGKGRGNRFVP
jgi:hypothetical protein